MLTWKTAALVALVTAQRAQTLVALDIRYMKIYDDKIVFEINELLKGSRPGKQNPPVELWGFTQPNLCVKRTVIHYINRSKPIRKSLKLFVSFRGGQAVTTPTVARWIRNAMEAAGIDVSVFRAHSLRGAAASKASARGVQLRDILATANWANEKTFVTFYKRDTTSPIVTRSGGQFADAILNE
jgi:integrase